jgi:hypothetical protein
VGRPAKDPVRRRRPAYPSLKVAPSRGYGLVKRQDDYPGPPLSKVAQLAGTPAILEDAFGDSEARLRSHRATPRARDLAICMGSGSPVTVSTDFAF